MRTSVHCARSVNITKVWSVSRMPTPVKDVPLVLKVECAPAGGQDQAADLTVTRVY